MLLELDSVGKCKWVHTPFALIGTFLLDFEVNCRLARITVTWTWSVLFKLPQVWTYNAIHRQRTALVVDPSNRHVHVLESPTSVAMVENGIGGLGVVLLR